MIYDEICPRKTFVTDVAIQEVLTRLYWAPMILHAVGLIVDVENLKNKCLVTNVNQQFYN